MDSRKVISILLTIFYASTNVALGAIAESNRFPLNRDSRALPSLLATLPRQCVSIQDVFAGDVRRSPIVLIQDVHMNAEAQSAIAVLLQRLVDRQKVSGIAIEGAFRPLALNELRRFPDKTIISTVAKSLLDHAMLGAPSYVGITSAAPVPPIVGVDDREHYEANVRAYQQASRIKRATLKRLDFLRTELSAEKEAVLPRRLREFDALRESYVNRRISLGEYVQRLFSMATTPDPVLERYRLACQLEKALNYREVKKQQQALFQKLPLLLSGVDMEWVKNFSERYRSGEITFGDYYRGLQQLMQSKSVSLQPYPAFENYLRYVSLSDAVVASTLFAAISRAEDRIVTNLACDQRERNVMSKARWLELTEKLVAFELTPEEWRAYQALSSVWGQSSGLDLFWFEAFYREADVRSSQMLRRASMITEGPVAVVTGGFHTPEMAATLRAQNRSFVVVAPKVAKIKDGRPSTYLSAFAREKTPVEKLFQHERLFLSPLEQNSAATLMGRVWVSAQVRWRQASRVTLNLGRRAYVFAVDVVANSDASQDKITLVTKSVVLNGQSLLFVLLYALPQSLALPPFGLSWIFSPVIIGMTLGGHEKQPRKAAQERAAELQALVPQVELLLQNHSGELRSVFNSERGLLQQFMSWTEAATYAAPFPNERGEFKYWKKALRARVRWLEFVHQLLASDDTTDIESLFEAAQVDANTLGMHYRGATRGKFRANLASSDFDSILYVRLLWDTYRAGIHDDPFVKAARARMRSEMQDSKYSQFFLQVLQIGFPGVWTHLAGKKIIPSDDEGLRVWAQFWQSLHEAPNPEDIPEGNVELVLPGLVASDEMNVMAAASLDESGLFPSHNFKLRRHLYAHWIYLGAYRKAAAAELRTWVQQLGSSHLEDRLRTIARFYQVAINAQFFPSVNNSILMDLVNLLLRLEGLEGVPHETLDFHANTLSSENFQTYFVYFVRKHQPLTLETLFDSEQRDAFLLLGWSGVEKLAPTEEERAKADQLLRGVVATVGEQETKQEIRDTLSSALFYMANGDWSVFMSLLTLLLKTLRILNNPSAAFMLRFSDVVFDVRRLVRSVRDSWTSEILPSMARQLNLWSARDLDDLHIREFMAREEQFAAPERFHYARRLRLGQSPVDPDLVVINIKEPHLPISRIQMWRDRSRRLVNILEGEAAITPRRDDLKTLFISVTHVYRQGVVEVLLNTCIGCGFVARDGNGKIFDGFAHIYSKYADDFMPDDIVEQQFKLLLLKLHEKQITEVVFHLAANASPSLIGRLPGNTPEEKIQTLQQRFTSIALNHGVTVKFEAPQLRGIDPSPANLIAYVIAEPGRFFYEVTDTRYQNPIRLPPVQLDIEKFFPTAERSGGAWFNGDAYREVAAFVELAFARLIIPAAVYSLLTMSVATPEIVRLILSVLSIPFSFFVGHVFRGFHLREGRLSFVWDDARAAFLSTDVKYLTKGAGLSSLVLLLADWHPVVAIGAYAVVLVPITLVHHMVDVYGVMKTRALTSEFVTRPEDELTDAERDRLRTPRYASVDDFLQNVGSLETWKAAHPGHRLVLLLRHGESVSNMMNEIQSDTAFSPLTTRGVQQKNSFLEFVRARGLIFDWYGSSTLERANETATPAAMFAKKPLHVLKRLREFGLISLGGIPIFKLGTLHPELLEEISENGLAHYAQGRTLGARMRTLGDLFWDRIHKRPAGEQTFLLGTHGRTIQYALMAMLKIPYNKRVATIRALNNVTNVASTLLEYDPDVKEWRLLVYSDNSYLPPGLRGRTTDPMAIFIQKVRFYAKAFVRLAKHAFGYPGKSKISDWMPQWHQWVPLTKQQLVRLMLAAREKDRQSASRISARGEGVGPLGVTNFDAPTRSTIRTDNELAPGATVIHPSQRIRHPAKFSRAA